MPKSIPAGLLAHYGGSDMTLSYGLRITRRDGAVFAFTSHQKSQRIGGVLYEAGRGLDVTDIVTSGGFEVGNFDLRTLDDGTLFTRPQVLGGLWQGAAFLCFRYNWADLSQGTDPLTAGVIGGVQMLNGQVICELRDLKQFLQQAVGSLSSKTCRARLGDARCRVDLAPFTHAGTVTSVTSRALFKAPALAQAGDYFAEGEVLWLTGANAGMSGKVKTHANSGGAVLTLTLPAPASIQVGDTFTAIAGCRKRLDDDCKVKFNNVLNFHGEPHRVGTDLITAVPEPSA